jgi:hypothetical protein
MAPKTGITNATTQKPLPPSPIRHLYKREESCGSLDGQYPNAQAPICADPAPHCTFAQGYQGCCGDNGGCTFYTSCNGGLQTSAAFDDEHVLQCPRATPYCSKFELIDPSSQAYEAYACGPYDPGVSTIYGYAGTGALESNPNTATSLISTFAPDPSGESTIFSRIGVDSFTQTPAGSSIAQPASTATGNSELISSNDSGGPDIAAIAGGVVGGVGGLALVIGAIICCRRRRGPSSSHRDAVQELQQGRAAMRHI